MYFRPAPTICWDEAFAAVSRSCRLTCLQGYDCRLATTGCTQPLAVDSHQPAVTIGSFPHLFIFGSDLKGFVMPSRPVPFARLVDLVEGRLAPEEAAQLRAQIADDKRATADVRWLERVVAAMRRDAMWDEAPPEEVVARAIRLFRPPDSSEPLNPLQRLRAMLQFDSLLVPQPVGLRSGQTVERQLLFTAGELSVDLRIIPAGPLWSLVGQVLGPALGGGQAALAGSSTTAEAPLNGLSEFVLPSVPAGDYTLTLRLAGVELEVDRLHVGL
jgi:hypothetical protein